MTQPTIPMPGQSPGAPPWELPIPIPSGGGGGHQGYPGSGDVVTADRAEHDANTRHNTSHIITRQGDVYGTKIADVLDLPYDPGLVFTMSIYGDKGKGPALVQYSIANGLAWLRNLSVQNRDAYNDMVRRLYLAGYLSEGDVKWNVFSTGVAQAFADAAYDTAITNAGVNGLGGADSGQLVTLMDNLDAIISGNQESGMGPGASDAAEGPIRQDHVEDEKTLKANIRAAAQRSLGRSLTDEEEAHIAGQFRAIESQWNNKMWGATQAVAEGGAVSVPDRPTTAYVADDLVRTGFAQEKAGEDLGSYIGVMRSMMGLDGEGMNGLG